MVGLCLGREGIVRDLQRNGEGAGLRPLKRDRGMVWHLSNRTRVVCVQG